jgi:cytochrome c-type biogenesis protein CcmH
VKILENALAKSPQNERALFFYGLHLRQAGEPARAAETWERLLTMLDPATSVELRKQIDEARALAGEPPLAQPQAGPGIHVLVKIDPMLVRDAKPGTMLYVFARSADGAGPPVAVKRTPLQNFPVEVDLGDGDSPMPTAKLSSQKDVLVFARLSQSGDARPASGDLEADPVTVAVARGAQAELTLSRSVP